MKQEITERVDGVELCKYYETEEFELPSVVYTFSSRQPDNVEIHLEEVLPEELDPEHVGFHPDYGRDQWEVVEDGLEFDYELDAGEEYRTVLAVIPASDVDVRQLVTEPATFEIASEGRREIEAVPGGSSEGASIADEGSTEEVFTRSTSTDEGHGDGPGGGPLPLDLADPNGTMNDPSSNATTDGSGLPPQNIETSDGDIDGDSDEVNVPGQGDPRDDGSGTEDGGVPMGEDSDTAITEEASISIGEKLAAELEAGTLSEEAEETIRRRLLAEERPVPGSVDARLDQLQNDVSRLRAYTNALEEFLDEEGSAEEIIARFDEQMRSFEDELASMEEGMGSFETELVSFEEDLRTVEQEIASLEGNVETIENDLQTVDDDVRAVEDEVETVGEAVERVNEDVEMVTEDVESVEVDVQCVTDQVRAVEDELATVETRADGQDRVIASLSADVASRAEDHDSLAEEVSTVQRDVQGLSSTVSRLEEHVPESDVDARLDAMEEDVAEATRVIDQIHDVFK